VPHRAAELEEVVELEPIRVPRGVLGKGRRLRPGQGPGYGTLQVQVQLRLGQGPDELGRAHQEDYRAAALTAGGGLTTVTPSRSRGVVAWPMASPSRRTASKATSRS